MKFSPATPSLSLSANLSHSLIHMTTSTTLQNYNLQTKESLKKKKKAEFEQEEVEVRRLPEYPRSSSIFSYVFFNSYNSRAKLRLVGELLFFFINSYYSRYHHVDWSMRNQSPKVLVFDSSSIPFNFKFHF